MALPTASREVIRRLEADGWELVRIAGSHHIFEKTGVRERIVVPHPRKDLSKPLVRDIFVKAGWPIR